MTDSARPVFSLGKKLAAEGLGTVFLLATVVGSGIMGDTLSGGNDGLALLANALATGAMLVVLILIFGPISGAHFNPAVTMVFAFRKEITPAHASVYILVQCVAGVVGVLLAHAMFDTTIVQASMRVRTGSSQWIAEAVATFGLLASILGCVRWRPDAVPYAVGLYITAGYWFTASTSFANPAVTLARTFTDTFAGIRLADAPAFIVAQLVGATLAFVVFSWLLSPDKETEES